MKEIKSISDGIVKKMQLVKGKSGYFLVSTISWPVSETHIFPCDENGENASRSEVASAGSHSEGVEIAKEL